MNDAERFFYEHAGFSYNPETETPDEGKRRTAVRLAFAEDTLSTGPYFIVVTPDDMPWDGDEPYEGPLWIVTLCQAEPDGTGIETLGSIGSVACESGDPYIRVVSADLMDEYLKGGSSQ